MRFKTIIFQKGNNLGIEVPENIIDKLGGGKKPPVIVKLKGYCYRSSVAVMQEKSLVAFSSEHRKHVQLTGGESLEVDLELDTEPRTVELPSALEHSLSVNKSAKEFFETLSVSNKKKIVALVESAKTAETQNKRLEKIITDLNRKIKP